MSCECYARRYTCMAHVGTYIALRPHRGFWVMDPQYRDILELHCTVLSASKNFFMSFLSAKDWISWVLHVSEPRLNFWGKPCVFGVSLQGVPEFLCHSHQTNLVVCEILVLGNPLLKWTVSLKTVQLSSTSSELCSSASKRLQRSLTNACLLLSCFSLETSDFFGTFLPCGPHTGWMRRLSLLTTSLWSVQQSAPHSFSHSDILSVLP